MLQTYEETRGAVALRYFAFPAAENIDQKKNSCEHISDVLICKPYAVL